MKHYPYLIIGGGMTADAAVKGIREVDPHGAIAMISAEPDPPYNRPPLSKALWKGKPIERVWLKTEPHNVDLILDCRIVAIEPRYNVATAEDGETFHYDHLLLATGGRPRRLPFGDDAIHYFRTLRDYRHLRELAESKQHLAVIGGGFVGLELAAALAMLGKQVSLVIRDEWIQSKLFPQDVGEHLLGLYRRNGVDMLTEQIVTGAERCDDGVRLELRDAGNHHTRELHADAVVAGIGIQPGVELAQAAGLYVNHGIWVDEFLRASHSNVFAAGDVANFHHPILGRRRIEHEDNALKMGHAAGRNMAGAHEPYHHLPYFYSDLFDLGYEAVGEMDSKAEKVVDWKKPYEEGVIYYLKDRRVRGVLYWNQYGRIEEGRQLIESRAELKI